MEEEQKVAVTNIGKEREREGGWEGGREEIERERHNVKVSE